MKSSDIFSIILVAGVGVLAAFLICQAILGDPGKASTDFKTVSTVLTEKLESPEPEIFNSLAVNPTIEVHVGDCEDLDQNGIIDASELEACRTQETDGTDGEVETEKAADETAPENGGE